MKPIRCTAIRTVTLMLFIYCPLVFVSDTAAAEKEAQSVFGKTIERSIRLLRGEKVTPGNEDWKKVCKRYENVSFPAADKPKAEDAATLDKCESYDLYYGFDKAADPVQARLCAYHEMESMKGRDAFSGIDMLMMIYANGVGAKRNLPLAIKLACKIEGAPAEMEERIAHLEQLKKQNWQGTDFSLCDDITSSYMQAICADHFESFAKINRKKKLMLIQAKWTAAEKADYALLRKAAERFFDYMTENEVDQSGLARNAVTTEEQGALEEEFMVILQGLNDGKRLSYSVDQFKAADSELNSVYRKIQKAEDEVLWGTITKKGIKETQREWIRYRDAWVSFCRKKYPRVETHGIKTVLTLIRTDQLKLFL